MVRWRKGRLDEWGEYDNDWYYEHIGNPEKYIGDILEFYSTADSVFHGFVAAHSELM